MLATQFESHHAREVFPCVDEPAAKATYDLMLITKPGLTTLRWMDHINTMNQLKNSIDLRALGQQDPAAAYANEGFDMFQAMVHRAFLRLQGLRYWVCL